MQMVEAADILGQIEGYSSFLVRDYLHAAANLAGTATTKFHHILLGVLALKSKVRLAK